MKSENSSCTILNFNTNMEHSDENEGENVEITVDTCSEPKAKSAKDRKRGKDKVKPLAKVRNIFRTLPRSW